MHREGCTRMRRDEKKVCMYVCMYVCKYRYICIGIHGNGEICSRP